MARYDKVTRVFRAKLATDWADADVGKVIAVGLNTSGQVVKGLGNTGVIGVLVDDGVPTAGTLRGKKAGTVVDVMTHGEIVEVTGLTPGARWYAGSDGVVDSTNTDAAVGHTVEAARLVVSVKGGV